MPDPSSKDPIDPTIPPTPCPDCGWYHTKADREAFEAAQKALGKQMSEILTRLGPEFDELVARLQLATPLPLERAVLIATLANWVMDAGGVPEDTFNRCLDLLIETGEEQPWMRMLAGKKAADA